MVIATIAFWGALLAHGGAVTVRWSETVRRVAIRYATVLDSMGGPPVAAPLSWLAGGYPVAGFIDYRFVLSSSLPWMLFSRAQMTLR
jgi:hypothetical protein